MTDDNTYYKIIGRIDSPDFNVKNANECFNLALSIEAEKTRARILYELVKALVNIEEIEFSEEIVSNIFDSNQKILSLIEIAKGLKRLGFEERALAFFQQAEESAGIIEDAEEKSWYLYLAAAALAESGFLRNAEILISEIQDPYDKASALIKLTEGYKTGEKNSEKLLGLVNRIQFIVSAGSFRDNWQKVEILFKIAKFCFENNFEETADNIVKDIINMVDSLESENGDTQEKISNSRLIAQIANYLQSTGKTEYKEIFADKLSEK